MARYRDSKTGKFVSQATWKRSKSHGGARYRKETTKARESRSRQEPEFKSLKDYTDSYRDEPEDFDSEYEFEGNADYARENER